MAAWQVEFFLVPRDAVATPRAAEGDAGAPRRAWTRSRPLPRDFAERVALLGLAPGDVRGTRRTWGSEDGNTVELSGAEGETVVRIAVDTRQLDARFAAALLGLVRSTNGALVRADGLVIDGTVGAFSSALRSSDAWRFVNDPTGLLTGRPTRDDPEDA